MIQMIGIDHTTAPVDVRALFAFRKSEMPEIMEQLKETFGAEGILILSTCNRTELWISDAENPGQSAEKDTRLGGTDVSPEQSAENDGQPGGTVFSVEDVSCQGDGTLTKKKKILTQVCELVHLETEDYLDAFIYREGVEAEEHLFQMTSGLKSAIIAEDQIVSQVREAEEFARNLHLSDSALQVLFRKAVTAAKRVKTEVVFHRANATAIEQALKMLEAEGFSVKDKKCLVIGNGEYGRLAADTLMENGADVTVTIRQYHSGEVLIPTGAKAILYGAKYEVIPKCDLIVSATASPNYTLFAEQMRVCAHKVPLILIDLAVPRDIDPEISKLDGCRIFDIDDFKSRENPENEEAYGKAQAIIEEELEDFHTWYQYRDAIPMIRKIGRHAAEDVNARLEKPLRKYVPEDADKDVLVGKIDDAAGKVVSNLFFYLRDHLDEETFRKCLNCVWEKTIEEEEEKE